MNHMKRLLAMLLALVMIVGVLPMSVFADEYGTANGDFTGGTSIKDTAVIFSDLHTSSGDYKESTVNGIMGALKNAGLPISSVTSAGDAFSVNSDSGKYTGKTSTISGYIRNALGDSTLPVNYVWSDHDRYAVLEDGKTLLDKTSHLVYGAGEDGIYGNADDDNYYIYVLSMADLSSNDRYSAGFNYTATNHTSRENAGFTATVELAIENFRNDVKGLDKSKPLLIVGHQPLLDRRDDNAWAEYWVAAINEVAKDMDVAYFHGHNHKYDKAEDYYYAKGSQMPVPDWDDWGWKYNTGAQSTVSMDSVSTTLNFTHICAGYMAPGSTGSTSSTTRDGVVLAVTVTDNKLQFTTYDKNGVSSTGYGVDITIDRDHANANVPKNLAVTGKIDYVVGNSIVAPTEVKVTYMDGNSGAAENYELSKITKGETEYTVEGFTFPEAGSYVLTYTCTVGNYQAQAALNVTVVAAAGGEEEPEEKPEEQVKLPVVAGANVTEVKDVTGQITPPAEEVTNYLAYDFTAEMIGETAIVSIPVPSDWVVGELNAYYVDAEGNITDESFEVSYVDGCAVFTVTHFSTYVLTNTRATLNWVQISEHQDKTIFRLTNTLKSGEKYVIVNRNTGNAVILNGSSIGTTTVTVIADSAGNYIVAPGEAAQWTFNDSSKLQNVGTSGQYLYASGSNEFGVTTYTTTNYSTWSYNTTNGLRARRSSSSSTYRNCSDYDIYVEGKIQTQELWAAVDAPATITYGVGEGSLADIKDKITVWTADNQAGNNSESTTQFDVSGTIDFGAAGTYTLTVMYGNVSLGTITVTVSTNPYLKITEGGEVKDKVVRIHAHIGDKIQLGVNAFDGNATVTNPTITWSVPSEYAAMASVDKNGMVTILNNNCDFFVEASWTTVNGDVYTDRIEIGVSPEDYLTPNVSDTDFPDYPNQGAIRYDKTATAVGNFSETGVAQMELSMTGIPYGGAEQFDIVLILDRSSSMKKNNLDRLIPTYDAAVAFVNALAFDTAGNPTNHNIVVADYHGGKTSSATDFGANLYSKDTTNNPYGNFTFNATYPGRTSSASEVTAITGQFMTLNGQSAVDSISNQLLSFRNTTSFVSGTDYDHALLYAMTALQAARDAGSTNKQFVVMMTDGVPTHLRYEGTRKNTTNTAEDTATFPGVTTSLIYGTDANTDMKAMFTGTNYNTRDTDYGYEYVSGVLKSQGVSIYTVGLGLNNTNSAWSGSSATQCYNAASLILNDISGPAYETTRDTGSTISKKDTYFFETADGSTEDLIEKFTTIASKISEAATNIVVTDKIAKEYTMIFGIPQSIGTDDAAKDRNAAVSAALSGKDLYIEVVNYTLNSAHERTGTVDSLTRIYLKDSNGTAAGGTYSAAIDNKGTAAPTLTFAAKDGDKPAYWAQVAADYAVNDNDIVVTVNGQKWKFMANGEGTHNVASGAYAHGTIHDKTNMSDDLVIVTPYFAYSAKTKMLAWTIDKVEEFKEIALRYFLYLDDSSTEIGTDIETPAGTYKTNEWAYLTYTNHLGNPCRQEFPKPQMTWNGAQVSYVFYLVNEAGQPVNKAGQVVDFANAVFVTDIFTKSVVWNDTDTPTTQKGTAYLDATWAANELLPSDYTLFDTSAYYELYVYADTQELLDAYFKITGSEANGAKGSTTKVYITKADTIKYDKYGTYTEGTDAVYEGFDFANTTVAFAVVWKAKLVEDTVVVDFGLDVLINVTQNDFTQNSVDGISKNKPSSTMGTGIYNSAVMSKDELGMNGHTISIASDSTIRFHQGNMLFDAPISFYYESKVTYHVDGDEETGYLYTKVTVIPATTIYYEDSFIAESDLKTYAWAGADWGTPVTGLGNGEFSWKQVGSEMNAVQQQDRPGKSQISAALDADNSYGYDAAYKNMSTYSMGSALKVHVDYDHMATASFSFYGTGFDVISLTTNTTGTIVVNVYDSSNKQVASHVVNTYYGMKYEDGKWVATTPSDPAALYQVPVMKISGLTYGQYRAEIKVVYDPIFDQGLYEKASYDFYLDAVRVYDPTGNKNQIANDAYVMDGEGWPTYAELRDLVIKAETFDNLKDENVSGLVFIDGKGNIDTVQDYISYGPNNELYLAKDQTIAFALNKEGKDFAKTGFAVDKVQLAIKSVGGTGHIVIKDSTGKIYYNMDVTTATDMYYDISALDGKDVIIQSTGSAIISMTNIKVTYKVVVTASENGEPPVSIMSLVRAAKTEEEETYLISVNAEMIERVLNVLNGKVEVKPERPFEPAPGKPSKPGSGNKPAAPKPPQPIKPSVPAKPIKPVRPVVPTMPVNPGLPAIPGRPAPVVAVHIY